MTASTEEMSVQPEWCRSLPLQQQSVLFLAARGPDGVRKFHPCKHVVRAYRGTVLVAARYGRPLNWGEEADSFMSLHRIAHVELWSDALHEYFLSVDEIPHHYHMHLMHGAEILAYKHPDVDFRMAWWRFYDRACKDLHLKHERESELDQRLGDWGREEWDVRA